jgi:hypothetical protein
MSMRSPSSKLIVTWRLPYAFVVVWLAAFSAMAPLVRREPVELRSTARIQFTVRSESVPSTEEMLGFLRGVVSQIVDPESLHDLCQLAISKADPILPAELGDDEVSRRLRIGLAEQPGAINLLLSFDGRGGAAEQNLVNRLANRLAIEVLRKSDQAALAQWLKNNSPSIDLAQQIHLAEQIRADVADMNEALAQIREHLDTSDFDALARQLRQLELRKERLSREIQLPEAHPEIVQVQREIERVRAAMLPYPEYRPQAAGTPTDALDMVKNQYYQASSRIEPGDPLFDLGATLSRIDLTRVGGAATRLKSNAESMRDVKRDLDAALLEGSACSGGSIAALSGVTYARSPELRGSTRPIPLGLLILPCLLGAVVAFGYNPVRDRMLFRSAHDVAKTLRVGVLGSVAIGEAAAPVPWTERWSANAVRSAEYSLLMIGGILLVSFALRPELMWAALANPAAVLSNWFWLIVR